MRAWRSIQCAWRGTRCSWESDEDSRPDLGVPTGCVHRLDSFRDDPGDQPRSDVPYSEFPRTLKETMGPGYIGGATIDRPFGTQLPKWSPVERALQPLWAPVRTRQFILKPDSRTQSPHGSCGFSLSPLPRTPCPPESPARYARVASDLLCRSLCARSSRPNLSRP